MQAQAVKQLGFICRQPVSQARRFGNVRVAGIVCGSGFGHGLQHRHALQDRSHFFQGGSGAESVEAQHFTEFNNAFTVAPGQRIQQLVHIAAVYAAQHQPYAGFGQRARSKGNRLIGK